MPGESLRWIATALVAMTIYAENSRAGSDEHLSSAESYKGSTAQSDGDVSFEQVRDWVETLQLRSVDDLLALLPEGYRAGSALIYESRSTQGASPSYPRTLLFGQSASLVMAFSGHPSQAGYDDLEMVQFYPAKRAFEFRKISFPAADDRSDAKPLISEANPPLCLSCHGERDPRPNWEAYPNWPGVYGSVNEFMPKPEARDFETFLKGARNQGRYRWLTSAFETTQNTRLSEALSRWNFLRLTRLIEALPGYPTYRFALAAASLNCPEPEAYLDNVDKLPGRNREFGARWGKIDFIRTENLAKLGLALELANGGVPVDWDGWAMPFAKDVPNFSDGMHGVAGLAAALIYTDPELGSLTHLHPGPEEKEKGGSLTPPPYSFCDDLKDQVAKH